MLLCAEVNSKMIPFFRDQRGLAVNDNYRPHITLLGM